MVSVELADVLPGTTEAGENIAVAPLGSPLAERATVPEKVPFCAVAMMVYCADAPGWTVCVRGVELSVNVGTGAAFVAAVMLVTVGAAA
jgi:hypothetical protein